MQVRLSALVVAVGAVAALVGCDDSTAFRAQFSNQEPFPTVYALSGTPTRVPNAIAVRRAVAVPVDASWGFDVAFDLSSQGEVQVLPVRSVATELSSVNRVGFRFDGRPFEEVTSAPTSGYAYDTTITLPVGRVLIIDVLDGSCAGQSFLGFNIRAKMVIDSVNLERRKIYLHMVSNPNCGFKSLVPGGELPKD